MVECVKVELYPDVDFHPWYDSKLEIIPGVVCGWCGQEILAEDGPPLQFVHPVVRMVACIHKGCFREASPSVLPDPETEWQWVWMRSIGCFSKIRG